MSLPGGAAPNVVVAPQQQDQRVVVGELVLECQRPVTQTGSRPLLHVVAHHPLMHVDVVAAVVGEVAIGSVGIRQLERHATARAV